jgi:hypothetical protein
MPPARKATKTTRVPNKVRALESFTCDVDGDPTVIHAGEVVSSRHAVVKGREAMFEPAEDSAHVDHG